MSICKENKQMSNVRIYTADDEEPKCGTCDYICDSDEWCQKYCGGANSWNGYVRTEFVEDDN